MADVDFAFRQQSFGVSEREWEAEVHLSREADDFRAGPDAAKEFR
ncbi:hypothetical protein [Ovoidimarina sediminis]|nr:hypothetical protein [Rhodophyticola sp. MJ-SS7]MDU8943583.1 hypothetical protein [Rhodophyticola sp. MJ-SS7]